MTKRLLRKTLIAGATIIALVLFVRILYWAGVYIEMRTNHTKYQELIGDNLTYEREMMDEQLSMALDWFEHRHLFNGDKGRICERISLIYQVKGDEMAYYRYLGYALYYLEQSDDKDYTVNIYLDLANFYINNYSYDSAQRMIESAQKVEPFEEIESLQVKSYAYRIQGMLLTLRGEYEEAEKCLNKSLEVVALSNTGYFEEAYAASKYNRGEIFEKMVTEYFGQIWVKDNVPFTEDGDITVDGIAYQIKFQKATFCNEKSIANLEK